MGLHYAETSALKNIGVSEAFEYIFEKAIESNVDHSKIAQYSDFLPRSNSKEDEIAISSPPAINHSDLQKELKDIIISQS